MNPTISGIHLFNTLKLNYEISYACGTILWYDCGDDNQRSNIKLLK
jgi:hypothetical protein